MSEKMTRAKAIEILGNTPEVVAFLNDEESLWENFGVPGAQFYKDQTPDDIRNCYDEFLSSMEPCPVEFFPPVITEGDDDDIF